MREKGDLFGNVVKKANWNSAVDRIRVLLPNGVRSYLELIDEEDRSKAEVLSELEGSEGECASSLEFLTQVLHCTTGKKVVLLIDEYEVPMRTRTTGKIRTITTTW